MEQQRISETQIKCNAKTYHNGDGYHYYIQYRMYNRAYMKCAHCKSCPGRAIMPQDPAERFADRLIMTRPHHHGPRPDWLLEQLVRKRILERCTLDRTSFRTIYREETAGLDADLLAEIPFKTLSRSMFRARRNVLGLISDSLMKDETAPEVNPRCGQTEQGELFDRVDKDVAAQLDYNAMSSTMLKAKKAGGSRNAAGVIDVGGQDEIVETQEIAGPLNMDSQPSSSKSNEQIDVSDAIEENLEGQPCSSRSNIQFDSSDILAYQDLDFGTMQETGMGLTIPTILEDDPVRQTRGEKKDGSKSTEKNQGDNKDKESSGNDTETTSNVILSETQTTPSDIVECEVVIDKSNASLNKPDEPVPDDTHAQLTKPKSKNSTQSLLTDSKLDNGTETLVTQPKSMNHPQSKVRKVKNTHGKDPRREESCISLDKYTTDIYFKKLEASVSKIENVTGKFLAASLTDKFDQFGKYLSSLLRGLPSKKVHSVKKSIISEVLQAMYEEEVPKVSSKAVGVQTDNNDITNTFQETSSKEEVKNANNPTPTSVSKKALLGNDNKCSCKRPSTSSINTLQEKREKRVYMRVSTGEKSNSLSKKNLSGGKQNVSTNTMSSHNNFQILSGSISSASTNSIPAANNIPMIGGNVPLVFSAAATTSSRECGQIFSAHPANVSTVGTSQAPIMSVPPLVSCESFNTVFKTPEGKLIAVTIPKSMLSVASPETASNQPALLTPNRGQKRKQPIRAPGCSSKKLQKVVSSPSPQQQSVQFSASPATSCNQPRRQMEIISPDQDHCSFTDIGPTLIPSRKNSDKKEGETDVEGGLDLKQEHEYFEAILCDEGSAQDLYIKEEAIELDDVAPSASETPPPTESGVPSSTLDPLGNTDTSIAPVFSDTQSSTPETVLPPSVNLVSNPELVGYIIVPTPFKSASVNDSALVVPSPINTAPTMEVVPTSFVNTPSTMEVVPPSFVNTPSTMEVVPPSFVNTHSTVDVVPPPSSSEISTQVNALPSVNIPSTVEVNPPLSVDPPAAVQVVPPPSVNQSSQSEMVSPPGNHNQTEETTPSASQPSNLFKCSSCNAQFVFKEDLVKHLASTHNGSDSPATKDSNMM